MKEVTELYNQLVDGGYFTDEELQLATYIGGYDIETLNDCIYHRYGYHSFGQMKGYE
jgi:hypothetical protein